MRLVRYIQAKDKFDKCFTDKQKVGKKEFPGIKAG